MFDIQIYRTDSGKEPFVEWQNELDIMTQARIDARLRRICLSDNLGDYKVIGDGVFELRFNFGPGYRIYFGKIRNEIILLLLGGSKGSQERDIKKAKQYWRDHISGNTRR